MKEILFLLVTLVMFEANALDPYYMPDTFPQNGAMALVSNSSGCSASLVAFDDYKKEQKALVLTNGHCTGKGTFYGMYPDGDDIFIDVSAQGTDIYLYNTEKQEVFALQPEKLLYATMLQKDIAVYQMMEAYKDLEEMGVQPLTISREPNLEVGTTYSMPSSYWKNTYQCTVSSVKVGTVKEGPWVWTNMVRFERQGCELKGGMSGSPLLNSKNEVIGLINTTYEGGSACSLSNPCEISDDTTEPQVVSGAGYGLTVFEMYDCRNKNGEFDVSVESCTLPE